MKIIKLVLLRHGESEWNQKNLFTGWTDINLTKKGINEARNAGKLLNLKGFRFDVVFTSLLIRATKTMKICLKQMGLENIPINYHWRLNERHYGALQGLNKKDIAKKYGDNQVHIWRRSYDVPPPELDFDDERHPRFDPKYNNLDILKLPLSESLKDTKNRFYPLWENSIVPCLENGKNVLIVAHGNSLRALIKHIDDISDKKIVELNIPTGIPLVYHLDKDLKPKKKYFIGDLKNTEQKTIAMSDKHKSDYHSL
tara:strand:- start:221 stop:985 length:765 start_codon:yes stop_codon:yes gene_type:complete